jgi:TPR repeat protein
MPVEVLPHGTAPPASHGRDEIADAIARARSALAAGDLWTARMAVYSAAAISHDPEAALVMGETYDPAVLAGLGKASVADPASAREWYRIAARAGSAEAATRFERVSRSPAR